MANTFSALKRLRQTEKRTLQNRARKTRVRHQIRAFRRLLAQNDVEAAQAAFPKTVSLIDKAARWGVVKQNTAARFKSKLKSRLVTLQSA